MCQIPDVNDVVIMSAVRTPIGRFGETLAYLSAAELGALAIRAALDRAEIPDALVDEVLMGNVLQAGQGQAPARQAALKAGLASRVPATTINKVCGSGLKTVMLATAMIRSGDVDVVVAGGMESMSNAPYLLSRARFGYRLGDGALVDAMVRDGLWCAFEDQHMGRSAEWIAREYNLSRAELDAFALQSHQRAIAAIDCNRFSEETVPVETLPRNTSSVSLSVDESPRRDTSLDKLASLRPVFDPSGMVTAGNASGISDGAAACVITRRATANALGLQPMARITAYTQVGVDPLRVFTAPVWAVRRLLEGSGTTIDDYELIEMNEAFAAQCLANSRELGLDWDKVNVNGGAIALGHPIGCSGTRVLVTLVHALRQRGLQRGLATLCIGGGEGVAMGIEMEAS